MEEKKPTWFQRIFINRDVFCLWMGQVISQSGDSIFSIALIWMTLELTGSKSATGLVAMAGHLPTLLFGIYMGALADRFPRIFLMRISDLARALLVLCIPLLYYQGLLTWWGLAFLTFGSALFTSLFNPARDSLAMHLVDPPDLVQANSLIHTSWQFAALIGPGIAGVLLIPFLGITPLFQADAITYLVSFCFIYRISRGAPPPKEEEKGLWKSLKLAAKDVGQGLQYVKSNRPLLVLLAVTAVDNLFIMGPAIVGTSIYVKEVLGQGASTYAYVYIAYAIGTFIGTVALNIITNHYGDKFRQSHILLWGVVMDGLTFIPLFWVDTFAGMFITIVIHALFIPMIMVSRPTLVQIIVPQEMQGRVFSMISVGVVGSTALSMAFTGIAAEYVSTQVIFGVIGVMGAACGAAGFLVKEYRQSP